MAENLPPLPASPAEVGDLMLQTREHVQSLGWGNREQLYTASQVRAYAAEAVKAERQACARICETTPPYPFRPSIEAAHAIHARKDNHG